MAVSGNDSNSIIRQNRIAYSRIADEWQERKSADFDDDFHERCRALFLEHLKGPRVLDAGCGLGLDSYAFASQGLQVTATDIVPEFPINIHAHAHDIQSVAMDLTATCFREESFDGIFACASFLHVPHEFSRSTLHSFAKILAPGGILFLNHVNSSKGLNSYQVDDLLIQDNPAFCFCHSQKELRSMLADAGLTVLASAQFSPGKYPSPCAIRNSLNPYQIVACKSFTHS
jgi:2-polyprenyl-3-methyl-5-hydroxy-6-metoxy-1,4-benzoquinol methylase